MPLPRTLARLHETRAPLGLDSSGAGKHDSERAADADLAFHCHVAAERPRQLAGRAESEPAAAGPARATLFDLPERLEDVLEVLLCDADAGVLNLEDDVPVARERASSDRAPLSKLHGIRE